MQLILHPALRRLSPGWDDAHFRNWPIAGGAGIACGIGTGSREDAEGAAGLNDERDSLECTIMNSRMPVELAGVRPSGNGWSGWGRSRC